MHSGDSSCVLPAQSLTLANALEVEHVVKRLGPALGVVGLLNVQLAIADSVVYVLEANPRASRTVPFASKATGINLVEAACRLAARRAARRPRAAAAAADGGQRQGSRAAVRPLPRRRPGARPGDALDGRGDGDRLRSADRVREGRARRRSAACRHAGAAFLSVRDGDKASVAPIAAALAGLGLRARRDHGDGAHAPRRRARGRGGRQGRRRGARRADRRRPDPRAPLQPRRQHARRAPVRARTAT